MANHTHTPEPWEVVPGDRGDDSVGVRPTPTTIEYVEGDRDPVTIATVIDEPCRRADREPQDEYDDCLEYVGDGGANARRIVACVNALQGVPTDYLERLKPGSLADVIDGLLAAGDIPF